jgi:hypothetical protein
VQLADVQPTATASMDDRLRAQAIDHGLAQFQPREATTESARREEARLDAVHDSELAAFAGLRADPGRAAPPAAAEPARGRIDLAAYASSDELELLGLDVLKAECQRKGLKCGGTLQERAERLWATRGVPEWRIKTSVDPALLAKPAKKRAAPRDDGGGGSTFRPQQGPMLPGATRRAGQKRLRSAPELLANLPAATRAVEEAG